MAARARGVVIEKPVVTGSIAFKLAQPLPNNHTHSWVVYLRGLANEDLSYFIKKVVFTLHPSIPNPVRVVEKPPYEVQETGWGEFEIAIKVFFRDPHEQAVTFFHMLRLHPLTVPIKGDTTSTVIPDRPTVYEVYDEIVFNEPTEYFLRQLKPNLITRLPSTRLTQYYQTFDTTEALKRVQVAQNRVASDIRRLRERLDVAEKATEVVRAEVSQLEQEAHV